ncbi:hypothetical protein [Bosea sp. MMO-172]|uniref:hypothetical protein n=1 Tax=Bosea sp. MMO-172 TaxID=3127885 RepID=UPI0030161131
MIKLPIRNFEDLARALRRFEELFGAPEGSAEACELRDISNGLRAFEDKVAARIATQRFFAGSLINVMPHSAPRPDASAITSSKKHESLNAQSN